MKSPLTTQPFLLSTIVQAFLYALYLISLAFTVRSLLYKHEERIVRNRREVNWFMFSIATFLFAFSTGDIVISALLQISFENNGSVFSKQLLLIAGSLSEVLTFMVIDAVLIFRCWTIYQRSWLAACVPLILWLSNFVLIVFFIVYSATKYDNDSPFQYLRPAVVFYSFNFATNLYTTSAIVYRTWRIANTNNNRSSILYRVCRIVAETGILYASSSLAVVVVAFLMAKDQVAYFVCNAINFSMAGLAFNFLLIRIGQLRTDVEIGVSTSMPNALNTSVTLSTVHFGVPSTAVNDSSFGSTSEHRGDPNRQETSMSAKW